MEKTGKYGMIELRLPRTNQGTDEIPEAVFCLDGQKTAVRGFAENEDHGTIRFMPTEEGEWTWEMTWGGEKAEGAFLCGPAECHGPVRTEGCHFRYDDGTRYVPVGTTCYAWIHQEPQVVADTLETLKTAPFNKMRMCIFPKSMMYNRNDPEFYPFEKREDGGWDVHRPDPRYWDHLDCCLRELEKLGIESDIILFHPYDRWGFSTMEQEDNLIYLDYAVRRLSAYHHVWWALSNEYEFSFKKTIADWDQFGELITREDPYHHLISAHNWITPYPKRDWLTHVSYQGGDPRNAFHIRVEYNLPVLVDEIGYEGDIEPFWGNLSGFEFMNRVWTATAFGCYAAHGETFHREDEVLWWAKGGKLYGKAPERLKFLRELLESLPGPMEPACLGVVRDPNGLFDSANPFILNILENSGEKGKQKILDEQTLPVGVHPDYKLIYQERAARSIMTLELPENGKYRVETVDIWEMTRETAKEEASGKITLRLPGKEGIAILVTRLEGETLA